MHFVSAVRVFASGATYLGGVNPGIITNCLLGLIRGKYSLLNTMELP